MKTKIFLAIAALLSLGMYSCDEASRLADKIEGVWSGTPVKVGYGTYDSKIPAGSYVAPSSLYDMSFAPTFTFVKSESKGGTLALNAEYSLSQGVTTVDAGASVKATVLASAHATGTWQAKDDDEIMVTFDPSTVTVSVDTTSLTIEYATLTDLPSTNLDSLKSRVAANIDGIVKSTITGQLTTINELDDIHFTSPSAMNLEIGPTVISFTRQ